MFEQLFGNNVIEELDQKKIEGDIARLQGRWAQRYRDFIKRYLDLALAIMLLPTILPVVAVLALLVKRDGGPAFFGHRRVGHNGREFTCWKIRSMVADSEARLEAMLASDPEIRAQWNRDRKLDNDPRITALGQFLRKSSLDELPQIWNVLKGEMSLVGPRPVPRDELEANYGGEKWAYHSVRPGVTGLWQVSGRNDVTYAERIRMDISYYSSQSLWLDVAILLRTATAVLNRTGK